MSAGASEGSLRWLVAAASKKTDEQLVDKTSVKVYPFRMVDKKETEFPFLNVVGEVAKLAGKRDKGTRIYRAEGSYDECGEWYERLVELTDDSFVSPGGVSMFAPVSRAAVHKRLKEGRITAFCFHVVHDEKTFFGTTRKAKERPYIYIPISECKAWAKELQERFGDRDGDGTDAKEVEKHRDAAFLDKDPDDKGKGKVRYVSKWEALDPMSKVLFVLTALGMLPQRDSLADLAELEGLVQ